MLALDPFEPSASFVFSRTADESSGIILKDRAGRYGAAQKIFKNENLEQVLVVLLLNLSLSRSDQRTTPISVLCKFRVLLDFFYCNTRVLVLRTSLAASCACRTHRHRGRNATRIRNLRDESRSFARDKGRTAQGGIGSFAGRTYFLLYLTALWVGLERAWTRSRNLAKRGNHLHANKANRQFFWRLVLGVLENHKTKTARTASLVYVLLTLYCGRAIIMEPLDYEVVESKEEIFGTTTAPVNYGSVGDDDDDDDDDTNEGEEEEPTIFSLLFEDNQFGDCVTMGESRPLFGTRGWIFPYVRPTSPKQGYWVGAVDVALLFLAFYLFILTGAIVFGGYEMLAGPWVGMRFLGYCFFRHDRTPVRKYYSANYQRRVHEVIPKAQQRLPYLWPMTVRDSYIAGFLDASCGLMLLGMLFLYYYFLFWAVFHPPDALINTDTDAYFKRGVCADVIVASGSVLGSKFWLKFRYRARSLRTWYVLDLEGESVDERFDEFFSRDVEHQIDSAEAATNRLHN